MSKKLTGNRLNESQRCEIISKLNKTNPPSKRALAREYDVSEGAIRKVWEKRDSIHGEGAEVDKNDLELLSALEELYSIIVQYDPKNVYNMDETRLFFCLLPRYSILMPNEDISSTRGKKKAKDHVSLIVCANTSGTHKIPCVMIGKPKEPACIKD
jgi:hypothetical protein